MATPRTRTTGLPPDIPYSRFALAGWRRNPSKIAVTDILHNEQLSFDQLEQRVLQTAGAFQKFGIGNQVKVQFFAENSLSAFVAAQAALFCNATLSVCSFDRSVKYGEYKERTDEAEVEYIITDADYFELVVREYLDDARDLKPPKVLLINGPLPNQHAHVSFIGDLESGVFVEPSVKPREDILLLVYTSGTTGRPKGVMHSHYSFLASLQTLNGLGWCRDTDRILVTSSLTCVSGVIFSAGAIGHAGTLLLADSTIEKDYPRYAVVYKPTMALLLEIPARNIVTAASRYSNAVQMMSSFQLLVFTGSVYPKRLQQALIKLFPTAKHAQLYGMAESMGPVTASDAQSVICARVGYAVPNTTVRLVNDAGKIVEVGEPGEILFKGPQRTLGLWKRVTEDLTEDGFYRTGDLGFIDKATELILLGPNKQFITCLDNRVAPTDIESVLLEHPAVDEVIVVGLQHPYYQQVAAALVVLKDASAAKNQLRSELINLVASRLSFFQNLHGGVFFADHLQKTVSGKYAREDIARTVQSFADS